MIAILSTHEKVTWLSCFVVLTFTKCIHFRKNTFKIYIWNKNVVHKNYGAFDLFSPKLCRKINVPKSKVNVCICQNGINCNSLNLQIFIFRYQHLKTTTTTSGVAPTGFDCAKINSLLLIYHRHNYDTSLFSDLIWHSIIVCWKKSVSICLVPSVIKIVICPFKWSWTSVQSSFNNWIRKKDSLDLPEKRYKPMQ